MKNIDLVGTDKLIVKKNGNVLFNNLDIELNYLDNSLYSSNDRYYLRKDFNITFEGSDIEIQEYIDITDLYKKVYNTLSIDQLTKLPNRNIISSYIDRCKDYDGSCVVALLDIDDLKVINDSYGHNIGDLVLRDVAMIMKSQIRDTDCVFRWGGDEFLLFLIETNKELVSDRLEQMRLSIKNHPFIFNSSIVNVTVSVGASDFNIIDETLNDAIERADKALYSIKNANKDGSNYIENDVKVKKIKM